MSEQIILDLVALAYGLISKLRDAWTAAGKSPSEFDTLASELGSRLLGQVVSDEAEERAILKGPGA